MCVCVSEREADIRINVDIFDRHFSTSTAVTKGKQVVLCHGCMAGYKTRLFLYL